MWEIDGTQIMSKKVFIASGHLGNFSYSSCKVVQNAIPHLEAHRFVSEKTGEYIPERASNDEIDTIIRKHSVNCPRCNGGFGPTNRFNMMFKVEVGPSADEALS